MSGKRKKTNMRKPLVLPKDIRNELRMFCAIKGYSELKSGKSRNLHQQRIRMAEFYHGKPPNRPSQIKLLADANINYRDLYDEFQSATTSKNSDESTATKYKLKSKLTLDMSRQYISGFDIVSTDLEKQFRQGKQLLSGRSILEMAQRGLKNYKKALAFCEQKWDDVKMIPKNSGDSEADVIEFVRQSMYKELEGEKNDEDLASDESEEEEVSEVAGDTNVSSAIESDTNAEKQDGVTTDPNSSSADSESNQAVTATASTATTTGNDVHNNNGGDGIHYVESTDSDISVPSDYIFPSFFVFVTRGPFVPPDKRLPLTLITDIDKKKGSGSRAELRNEDKIEKKEEAASYDAGVRGFSTDQRIEIENLNVRKKTLANREREQRIVGYAIEQEAITKQIEIAERRARMICPDYDEDNTHWQRVERLLEEQEQLIKKIRVFNEEKPNEPQTVSNFMNKPSPNKEALSMNPTAADDESSSTLPSVVNIENDLNCVIASKETPSKRKAASSVKEKRRVRTRSKKKY